jgi:signal transduction histidine kinase
MCVTDDGSGMANHPPDSGMGFHIMNYRAHTIGGTLEIKSLAGSGTTVICRVPVENSSKPHETRPPP